MEPGRECSHISRWSRARADAGLRKFPIAAPAAMGMLRAPLGWTDTMAKNIGQAVREVCLGFPESVDKDEVRELALFSYRHFALKRMLQQLEPETES